MPYSVIVGGLHKIEGDVFTIGGGVRIKLAPGVRLPDVPPGTSLTVTAVERDGVLYAEKVRATTPALFGGLHRTEPAAEP